MEDLSDPLGDRVMKDVPPIARYPLKREELWHASGKYPYFTRICVHSQEWQPVGAKHRPTEKTSAQRGPAGKERAH